MRDGERHGYQIIQDLRERIGGDYSPSAGTVYPRLRQLEREGFVRPREEAGRIFYRLTVEGEEELRRRADQVEEVEAEVGRISLSMAATVKAEVERSAKGLRAELRAQAEALRAAPPELPYNSDLQREVSRLRSAWAQQASKLGREAAARALRAGIDAAIDRLQAAAEDESDPGPQ
ncbi:MAG: PadR family transcriptional regulator [Candidatus Dormibacteria bacterium]